MTGSADRPTITVGELEAGDTAAIADFYERILVPHFRADELIGLGGLRAGLKSGNTRALVARRADGVIAGGAVGDLFPESGVVLLSYLAVPPEGRGAGTGGALMTAAAERWKAAWRPPLMVMEVEDPRHFGSDEAFGDPYARVRFYERLGARALPVPYFQPALGRARQRVPHLLLMVFGGTEVPPGTTHVNGWLVESFLIEYLEECEDGDLTGDEQAQRLLAACRRPGGLPLLPLRELPADEEQAGTSG
jgi:GNAT superfamily N-acetyltransferase